MSETLWYPRERALGGLRTCGRSAAVLLAPTVLAGCSSWNLDPSPPPDGLLGETIIYQESGHAPTGTGKATLHVPGSWHYPRSAWYAEYVDVTLMEGLDSHHLSEYTATVRVMRGAPQPVTCLRLLARQCLALYAAWGEVHGLLAESSLTIYPIDGCDYSDGRGAEPMEWRAMEADAQPGEPGGAPPAGFGPAEKIVTGAGAQCQLTARAGRFDGQLVGQPMSSPDDGQESFSLRMVGRHSDGEGGVEILLHAVLTSGGSSQMGTAVARRTGGKVGWPTVYAGLVVATECLDEAARARRGGGARAPAAHHWHQPLERITLALAPAFASGGGEFFGEDQEDAQTNLARALEATYGLACSPAADPQGPKR